MINASGVLASQASYQWSVQSNTGLTDLGSIASSPTPALLYIAPGQLMADSKYKFTCSAGPAFSSSIGQASPIRSQAAISCTGLVAKMYHARHVLGAHSACLHTHLNTQSLPELEYHVALLSMSAEAAVYHLETC